MKWLVGIPTYKRPEQLRKALNSLAAQNMAPNFSVCVIDNDPEGSAKEVVSEFKDNLNIISGVETRPGVVHVRNQILDIAADFDYLVFLDDDQVVEGRWLYEFERATEEFPGAFMAGPRSYELPKGCLDDRLTDVTFRTPRRNKGAQIKSMPTGNSLVPVSELSDESRRLRFDPRYSFIGGEDTKFYREHVGLGAIIRWWPDAKVVEAVPAERASREAMEVRLRRAGHVNAMLDLEKKPRISVMTAYLARIVIGSLAASFGCTRNLRTRGRVWRLSGTGGLEAVRGRAMKVYGV